MKTGKAYAFLDYEGRVEELVEGMNRARAKVNFPDTLSFKVLGDRVSTGRVYDEKGELPAEIIKAAEVKDIYGTASISEMSNIPEIPKKAADLRYIIMATALKVSDAAIVGELRQGNANRLTAGMLNEVLWSLGSEECRAGRSKFLRAGTFFQNSPTRAQMY